MRLPLINKDDTLVAVWRLLNFPIHQRYPTVVHLAVHLEGGQRVHYEPEQPPAHLTDPPPNTTLTAFFYLCKTYPLAKTLLYSEVLDIFAGMPVKREAFHTRLLLHHVRGPISFEDLKTVIVRGEDGDILEIKPCSTYTEACQVLGLLEDDSHWYKATEEAAVSQSPAQLRNLFAILVAVCGLNKPITLWENHKEDMTEDILHQARRNNPTETIEYSDDLINNTLLILEDKILSIIGHTLALYGLPEPVHDQPELTSKDVLRETSYDVQALRAYMAANVPDQQQAFIAVTGMIGSESGGIFFLDAPGGTGKTFLPNLLLYFVRKEKDMAVAVASPGIAATLLAGGRTANSAFKLPLDLARSDSATCNICTGTGQGHVLKTCKLIVWDVATMSHRNAFHALDKTLQDLRGSSAIMGGATVVLAGQFANKLLQIGDGKVPEDPSTGLIIMPCGQIVNSPDELLFKVYPKIRQNFKDQDWLSHRAILASRNDVVEKLNVIIQKQLPGKEYAYKVTDPDAIKARREESSDVEEEDSHEQKVIYKFVITVNNYNCCGVHGWGFFPPEREIFPLP
ncbi:ATP-dependent DNA helicase [Trichonephila clavata]|uniref:ATP-dependent DNA helicase n=1 Tax=Trichonephila clavata TaxID=2740835 RepID=A0A8X6GRU9_TRICU|nr:ATP-dependent DNA helicase [Trichonephila clavata]